MKRYQYDATTLTSLQTSKWHFHFNSFYRQDTMTGKYFTADAANGKNEYESRVSALKNHLFAFIWVSILVVIIFIYLFACLCDFISAVPQNNKVKMENSMKKRWNWNGEKTEKNKKTTTNEVDFHFFFFISPAYQVARKRAESTHSFTLDRTSHFP